MLKKKYRLKGEEIKNFFSRSYQKISNDIFLVYFQKNNLNHPRFAILPQKEVFKKAVQRNKARRRVYAIIREFLKKKKTKNYDFFIILRKDVDFLKLKESLIRILINV
ncbi:MAG: hypothetical protein KatS3mg096_069 [Candidatus Parcubacteria bacterium]|nr:MAG: hypothetical protein KatS3mg096_069 [Candidatus Parcubacteria bacterium]